MGDAISYLHLRIRSYSGSTDAPCRERMTEGRTPAMRPADTVGMAHPNLSNADGQGEGVGHKPHA